MLNVTKELTALARKLGYTGKAPDTVAKAINAITASVGEGGGEGGGGSYIVPITVTVTAEDKIETVTFTSTKTFAEIQSAIETTPVFLSFSFSSEVLDETFTVMDCVKNIEAANDDTSYVVLSPYFDSLSLGLETDSIDGYPTTMIDFR